MSATPEYENIYGRKWGRGLRPWLLVPKILFAGTFIGGLVTVLVLGFYYSPPQTPADWVAYSQLIQRAFTRVIVPALLGAILTGIALAMAHPMVFLRMRWFQAKLVLLIVCVPVLHVFMWGRSVALREAVTRDNDLVKATLLREQIYRGTIAALVFAVAVVVLGRIKPRLRQAYGRTFTRRIDP
ncbi:MAG: hypothetical protein AMXMBFR13_51510 [Phycisphaerae bacterium]